MNGGPVAYCHQRLLHRQFPINTGLTGPPVPNKYVPIITSILMMMAMHMTHMILMMMAMRMVMMRASMMQDMIMGMMMAMMIVAQMEGILMDD
jgi:hypothetical protein